jgi:tetratricopeptide (TPR) repeat protein
LAERGRSAEQRGTPREALGWYDRALASLEPTGSDTLRSDLLRWKGTVHRECGETSIAEELYEESRVVASDAGYRAGEAHAVNCLAAVAQRRGDLATAESRYAEAARLAVSAGDLRLVGMVQQNLGILANIRGDWDIALASYRSSLRTFEQMNDEEAMSWVLNNLGMLLTDQRRFTEADAAFGRGLELARTRGDLLVEGTFELNRAEMLTEACRWRDAEEGCLRAMRIAERRGDRLRRAEALRLIARIRRNDLLLDHARAAIEEARVLTEGGEDALLVAELLSELGEVCHSQGQVGEAREAWREAHWEFTRLGAFRDAGAVEARLATLVPAM